MVGSSVVPDGTGGAVESGALIVGACPDGAPVAGASGVGEGWDGGGGALEPGGLIASPDGVPVAGAPGVGEGWVGAGGGVCAEARTLSAASTHNATAH
jgi:hypothetical protein